MTDIDPATRRAARALGERLASAARDDSPRRASFTDVGTIEEVMADGTALVSYRGGTIGPLPMTTDCVCAARGRSCVIAIDGPIVRVIGIIARSPTDFELPASCVTGTLGVAHGGTGATTAAGARSSLGVVSKEGDTVAGPISRAGGGSFRTARDNATVRGTSRGQQYGYSFNAVASQLTSSGSWTMGNLSGDESLKFAYTTNKDYDAGNNTASLVSLPAKQGTIVTSASVGSGLKFSDGTLSVDNGAYVNLYTDSANNGYCAYRRSGGLVCVVCDYVSSTAKTNKKLGTLPAGCRPARTVLGMAYPRGANSCGQITVDPDGKVSLYTFEGSSGYVGGSVTFPLP